METDINTQTKTQGIFTPEALLEHWQGHRRVTRSMIEAFPEDKLFTYSIGGMRPFSDLVMEFIGMAEPGIDGVATGNWNMVNELPHHAKNNLPKQKKNWLIDGIIVTEKINKLWPQIPAGRFNELG